MHDCLFFFVFLQDPCAGRLHPLLKVRKEFREIFLEMGFEEMPTSRCVCMYVCIMHVYMYVYVYVCKNLCVNTRGGLGA
jgi:hypothetical protein